MFSSLQSIYFNNSFEMNKQLIAYFNFNLHYSLPNLEKNLNNWSKLAQKIKGSLQKFELRANN